MKSLRHLVIRLARAAKRVLIASRSHRVLEIFSPLLTRLVFGSKLSLWCAEHGSRMTLVRPGHVPADRYDLYELVASGELQDQPVTFLEFGVGAGHSFRWWADRLTHPDSRFVGFDTFSGLPEKWGVHSRGAFSTSGEVPAIRDSRCAFHAGLFQETLPGFLSTLRTPYRKVIHLDADLYSSTLFVLTSLAPMLAEGDVLLFDEFNVPTHEFRAFTDFVAAYALHYEVLGAARNFHHVALRVTGPGEEGGGASK